MAMPTITRTLESNDVETIRISTSSQIINLIADDNVNPVVAIADLSLGAWRSHQVAQELADQLSLTLPIQQHEIGALQPEASGRSFAEVIGSSVEAEARGQMTALMAHACAQAIVTWAKKAGKVRLAVISPRFGNSWGEDNLHFVYFLRHGLVKTEANVAILRIDDASTTLQEEAKASLAGTTALLPWIPSSISPETKDTLNDRRYLIPLKNGAGIVQPECRILASANDKAAFNVLAQLDQAPHWLRAYGQFHCEESRSDPHFLAKYAWQNHWAGSYEIAIRFLERVVEYVGDEIANAAFRVQLCAMALAANQFVSILDLTAFSPRLPPSLRGFLLQSRGWALTMTGRAPEGKEILLRAQALLRDKLGAAELLYLLNITALSCARSSEPQRALDIEQSIWHAIRRRNLKDYNLRYLNAINLARLFLRTRNFSESERHYREAFEVTLGNRSEGERMYTNICLARTALDQGKSDAAFLAYFRAALHFVACSVPEAIARRYVNAVYGGVEIGPLQAHELPVVVERVAAALIEKLAQHSPSEFQPPHAIKRVSRLPTFLSINFAESLALDAVFSADGWVVVGRKDVVDSSFDGPNHRLLRERLGQLIAFLATPNNAAQDISTYYVVDDWTNDLSDDGTFQQALATAVQWRTRQVYFERKAFSLSDQELRQFELNSTLSVGLGVEEIISSGESQMIKFKRFRREVVVPDKFGLLNSLRFQKPLSEFFRLSADRSANDQLSEEWRTLQRLGAVSLKLAEKASDALTPTVMSSPVGT